MELSNKEDIILNSRISDKQAIELEKLAKESGYDSIRFFIAPDKSVSPESVIEDVKTILEAKKSGKKLEQLYHVK